MTADRFEQFHSKLRAFIAERDWEKFHNPKNLAMALAGEAGELLAEFQWLTPEESDALAPAKHEAVAMEIADVFIYMVELCDRLGIDPIQAAESKLARNAVRYPVERSRGLAKKYDEL